MVPEYRQVTKNRCRLLGKRKQPLSCWLPLTGSDLPLLASVGGHVTNCSRLCTCRKSTKVDNLLFKVEKMRGEQETHR